MKIILALVVSLFSIISAYGQNITGQWNGVLKLGATQLRLVIHIKSSDTGFTSTMDSPDQGANGIPVTTTTFEDSRLKLEIASPKIEYSGVLKGQTISGTFKQGGQEFPLDLTKGIREKAKRPQEPKPPYPYHSEDITFRNEKANITLAGTLTLPKESGTYPAVILISGSGAQNRDEELFGHKPFRVLADHLTKLGIAVLRYDDRGYAKSQGDFQAATFPEFISDVESAIAYLKTRTEINKQKIGLVGHSEGGIIACEVASKSPDVKFIVMLAGPGIPGYKLLLLQKEKIELQMGIPQSAVLESQKLFNGAYEIILASPSNDPALSSKINTYFKDKLGNQVPEAQVNSIAQQLVNPWMLGFLRYDPMPVLKRVKIPVLALNGEKDVQVPAQENLTGISKALAEGGNKQITIKDYPNLNHLFQECKTCQITEYGELEETFSPVVLDDISAWIIKQVNGK